LFVEYELYFSLLKERSTRVERLANSRISAVFGKALLLIEGLGISFSTEFYRGTILFPIALYLLLLLNEQAPCSSRQEGLLRWEMRGYVLFGDIRTGEGLLGDTAL